jgi:diguanylate cyclase (GGDEF)-like protein
MSTFAQQVASALNRAELFQEIQNLALTDPLTGLQNRRSLFDLGRIEFARAQRMKRPFCCLMLDLDHFKNINDTYGHPIGDLVVQEFARCCKHSVREVDLIGRYGGEEILIFLPETDSAKAIQVAERVREVVANLPIQTADQELHITVSIGVSRRDENTIDLETLVARADQALYIAKYKGRNQVAVST